MENHTTEPTGNTRILQGTTINNYMNEMHNMEEMDEF